MVGLEPEIQPSSDKDEVLTALFSPLDYTSIPLRLSWSALPAPDKEIQVELALVSPPGGVTVDPGDSRVNLDYMAFIVPVGKTEGRTFPVTLTNQLDPKALSNFLTSGFRFRKQFALAPGRYAVRVFLRDNLARKTGTVSTLIDISAAATSDKAKP